MSILFKDESESVNIYESSSKDSFLVYFLLFLFSDVFFMEFTHKSLSISVFAFNALLCQRAKKSLSLYREKRPVTLIASERERVISKAIYLTVAKQRQPETRVRKRSSIIVTVGNVEKKGDEGDKSAFFRQPFLSERYISRRLSELASLTSRDLIYLAGKNILLHENMQFQTGKLQIK